MTQIADSSTFYFDPARSSKLNLWSGLRRLILSGHIFMLIIGIIVLSPWVGVLQVTVLNGVQQQITFATSLTVDGRIVKLDYNDDDRQWWSVDYQFTLPGREQAFSGSQEISQELFQTLKVEQRIAVHYAPYNPSNNFILSVPPQIGASS